MALIMWRMLSFYCIGHFGACTAVLDNQFSSLSIVYAFWVSQSNEAIMKYFTLSLQFLQKFQICYLNHLARYNFQSVSRQGENLLLI